MEEAFCVTIWNLVSFVSTKWGYFCINPWLLTRAGAISWPGISVGINRVAIKLVWTFQAFPNSIKFLHLFPFRTALASYPFVRWKSRLVHSFGDLAVCYLITAHFPLRQHFTISRQLRLLTDPLMDNYYTSLRFFRTTI